LCSKKTKTKNASSCLLSFFLSFFFFLYSASAAAYGDLVDSSYASTTDSNLLIPITDASITKTDNQLFDLPGTSITYTIVVTNQGPSDAVPSRTTVVDTFSSVLTGVAWNCTAIGATCNAGSGQVLIDNPLMKPFGNITYIVTAMIASSATGILSNAVNVTITNSFSGVPQVVDTNTGNNFAQDNTTLTPIADTSISKSDNVTFAVAGTDITYTIIAVNRGPSDAGVVSVLDQFISSLNPVSWICQSLSPFATCGNTTLSTGQTLLDYPTLYAGGSVQYIITARILPSARGSIANNASVYSLAINESLPGNNVVQDIDTLVTLTDVSITKSDGLTQAFAGTTITYTINVTNSGPSEVLPNTLSVIDYFSVPFLFNVRYDAFQVSFFPPLLLLSSFS